MVNYYEKKKVVLVIPKELKKENLIEYDDLSLLAIYTQLLLSDGDDLPFLPTEERDECLDSERL